MVQNYKLLSIIPFLLFMYLRITFVHIEYEGISLGHIHDISHQTSMTMLQVNYKYECHVPYINSESYSPKKQKTSIQRATFSYINSESHLFLFLSFFPSFYYLDPFVKDSALEFLDHPYLKILMSSIPWILLDLFWSNPNEIYVQVPGGFLIFKMNFVFVGWIIIDPILL